MSKKSYKQMQNRLYREIKRRIQAEYAALVPLDMSLFRVQDRQIETIMAALRVGDYIFELPEMKKEIKFELAGIIAKKLVNEGYVKFKAIPRHEIFSYDVEARLKVLRSEQEDGHDDNGLL